MTTNVLLIIIIVLLILLLFFQVAHLLATYTLDERILDSFLDFFAGLKPDSEEGTIVDIVDLPTSKQEEPRKSKGFGKSRKSKRTKRTLSRKADDTSNKTDQAKAESIDTNGEDK